ncbi:MAG: hypothetical protein WC391_03045 [Methanoregula sp.]|jgi:hypothetical protein
MVILIGLLMGTGIGLSLGFLLGKQKPDWSNMSLRDKKFNVTLVSVCSVIAIAGLAWYFLIR